MQDELNNIKESYEGHVKLIEQQRNEIAALKNKVNYKDSQFEDCERDKSRILKQLNDQMVKYTDLKSMNEVIQMVEKSSKNFEWAN